MTTLFQYFKSKKQLISMNKELCYKLKVVRKQSSDWQKLAMNSADTLLKLEDSVVEIRKQHRDKADELLYGN